MKPKTAIITGIAGQDGSYLAELLLGKGYRVHGIIRRSSLENEEKMRNISHIRDQIKLAACSLDNSLSVYKLFAAVQPDECYHLAASSFVSYSLEDDLPMMINNFSTTHNILLGIVECCPRCRLYFAGSSEIFGNARESPQTEGTACNPRSVYGISKLSGHCLLKNYRARYHVFACTGFTYNHESPRRGMSFVTRKITSSAAAIALGRQHFLELGNLDAARDWGYAPEYADAMWRMLQAETPRDYVIATGKLHTVRDVLEHAFSYVGLDYSKYVRTNAQFVRPADDVPLVGDPSAIARDLGWHAKRGLREIIREMVDHDLALLKNSSK